MKDKNTNGKEQPGGGGIRFSVKERTKQKNFREDSLLATSSRSGCKSIYLSVCHYFCYHIIEMLIGPVDE